MSEPTASPTRRAARPTIVTAIVLVVAVAAAVLLLTSSGQRGADPAVAADPGADPGADPALGDPDAPVVMVEYSDFACPFCGQFARDTKPELIRRYIDRGILYYVWRDAPMLGEPSRQAALAGRAAHAQGGFWAFHDALFAADQPALTPESLRAVAGEIGLDVDAFAADLAGEVHESDVERGLAEAFELGLTGTPSFTINGEIVIGAQPLEVFVEAIEAAHEQA